MIYCGSCRQYVRQCYHTRAPGERKWGWVAVVVFLGLVVAYLL